MRLKSKTRRRAILLLPTLISSCQAVGTVNFALSFTTSVAISILQTFRSWVATHLKHQGLLLIWIFYSEGVAAFQLTFRTGICQGTFEIVSKEVLLSVRGPYQTIRGPPLPNVTRLLEDYHIQWHPPLIRHYTNCWPCYWSGPYYRIWLFTQLREVSIEHLQRVRHANRGHLVLSHIGTCMRSNVETNTSWTCFVSGLLSFEHSYVLLINSYKRDTKYCEWLTLLPRLYNVVSRLSDLRSFDVTFLRCRTFIIWLELAYRSTRNMIQYEIYDMVLKFTFLPKFRACITLLNSLSDIIC